MPIYEYVCEACGHEFDAIQKFSEKPIKECPKCGKKKAKRKLSASAFHLKGSGWYVTDYKKSGAGGSSSSTETASEPKPAESKPAEPAKTAESKPEPKSESKAGTKPEGKSSKRASAS